MSLDPLSVKRADFHGGIPVIMADGQVWTLVRPTVRMVPTDDDVGLQYTIAGPHADEYENLIEQYDVMFSSETPPAFHDVAKVELGLGKCLLLSNYDLTTKQLRKVLAFSYRDGDEEGKVIRDAVLAIAFGNDGPKPSAVGTE